MKNPINLSLSLFVLINFACYSSLFGQSSAINPDNLEKLIEFSKETNTDEIMLIHNGEVVSHWRNTECDSVYFNTASMVKSWTGLVVGILIDKGIIESEDELICRYVPEWKDGCKNDVTIKHLLTMSAGINKRRGAEGILAADSVNQYAINMELDTFPDVRFQYSNESVQLLGVMIENATGMDANYVYQKYLFDPLGMDSTSLYRSPIGDDVVFGGAKTTIDDASNIGLLMLNGGKHNDVQIVPEEWVKKSITPSDKAAYYGYLWWIDNFSADKNYAATGDGGKLTIVFPGLNLVFLRQQSCNLGVGGNMPWMGPAYLKLIASTVKTDE